MGQEKNAEEEEEEDSQEDEDIKKLCQEINAAKPQKGRIVPVIAVER